VVSALTQVVIAIVGVSGVGKTTKIRQLRTEESFQHLTAGSLILKAHSSFGDHREGLRLVDIARNQQLLVEGFNQARDRSAKCVVVDGHVVIDTPDGIQLIDPSVFKLLNVTAIIHLEDKPEQIFKNRVNDSHRTRPSRTILELADQQSISIKCARRVCKIIGVPFLQSTTTETEKIVSFINQQISSRST